MVRSLASITGHTIVRHGAAVANALGLTTQVPVRQIYLTDGRARTLKFGKQVIEIRRAPKWMLALGDSTAGDVIRALEWLGPDLAEQAIDKLAGHIGQDDWSTVLEARAYLPAWMVLAIQNGLAARRMFRLAGRYMQVPTFRNAPALGMARGETNFRGNESPPSASADCACVLLKINSLASGRAGW